MFCIRHMGAFPYVAFNPDLARVGYYSAFFVKPSRFSPGGFIKREFWQVQQ